MPTLSNGSGALRINVPRGSSLIIRNQSGVETVTGSSVTREDAAFALGAGAFVYGPQTSASDVSITTTGTLTYDIVAGDPTPASTPAVVTRSASTGAPSGLIDPATGQAVGGGGGGVAEATLRNVARSCHMHNDFWAMDNFTARSKHRITAPVYGLRIVWANLSSVGVETNYGALSNFECAIEYPVGTFTRVTFGGAASTSIAAGGIVESDEILVRVPAGADIYVRTYGAVTPGQACCRTQSTFGGDNDSMRVEFGTTAAPVTNKVLGGTVAVTNAGISMTPLAIVGLSAKPSYWVEGDSRVVGPGGLNQAPYFGEGGQIAPSLFRLGVAYTQSCRAGARVANTVASYTKRGWLIQKYFTHVIFELAVNDLDGTQAMFDYVVTNVSALRATFPGHKWIGTTITPVTTGTYITLDGQTPAAKGVWRERYNAGMLANSLGIGFDYVVDVNSVVEGVNSAGQKVWLPGLTVDGLHESVAGTLVIAQSSVFDVLPVN